MTTQCTPTDLHFHALGRREVMGRFDGGRITSDAGGVLLRETDLRLGLLDRLARCFRDYRTANSVEHRVRDLLAQRVYGLALGYEDLNDHDALRSDSLLALLVGKTDLMGASRARARDRGNPLAGSSTLNRLELGTDEAASDRYKRIAGDPEAMDRLLVEVFLESHPEPPGEIILDLDATDDPLHGHQEGRFFHGYYRQYCYLPLYIFSEGHLLHAGLRASNIDASTGSVQALGRIVDPIRQHWPKTRIMIRADSGFCREEIMCWCEARAEYQRTDQAARQYRDFQYRTLRSWSRARRVIGKAEYLPRGKNPRFVVTNLSVQRAEARPLYEELYCARGDMENRIKEQQLGLFADRTSTATLRTNPLRLYFASFACVLMHGLRRLGQGPVHHDSGEGTEDRGAREGQCAQGLVVVLRSLPPCTDLSADLGPSAYAPALAGAWIG